MTYRKLYTRDSSGNVRHWRMEVDGGRYRTVSGVVGGADVTTAWKEAAPKNVGRSNETTAAQQAVLEVEAQYKKKLDRKYYENEEVVGRHRFFAPMLAHKYSGWNGPGFTQPKLDGFRCIGSTAGLTSRAGKQFYLPHITEALAPWFAEDPNLVLDGELYNHDLRDDFNTLGSLIKKEKRTAAEEETVRETIQYHVYDLPSHTGGFRDRSATLRTAYGRAKGIFDEDYHGSIKVVRTHAFETQEELDTLYAEFMADGYEGGMVRYDDPYEGGKRSKSLLKRKEFEDGEFELVSVDPGEGNWAGYAKSALIRVDGVEQRSGMRGSQEFTRELLQTWQKFKKVTVRYQNRTPDNFLRFPVVVDWHEDERDH